MAEVKKFVTPVFRASFPHVFEADSYDGGEPKFGLSAVWTPEKFTKSDKKRWKAIMAGLDEECKSAFKKAWKDLPANYKTGIRDGAEKSDLEGYGEGTRFANITSKMRPGVIDLEKDPIDENDPDGIYPGCYCRATITIYSYDKKGKGVALGLQNIQKVGDGERLDNRTDASEDFEDDIDEKWLEAAEEDEDLSELD